MSGYPKIDKIIVSLIAYLLFSFYIFGSFCTGSPKSKPAPAPAAKESFEKKGDVIIKGFSPPENYYEIKGGSCGEAALWSVYHAAGLKLSQKEINKSGGLPGRGLYSHELFWSLRKNKIAHKNISQTVTSYDNFINTHLIGNVKKKWPVLLGVKVYPDEHPNWACDHFILVIGYNTKRKELIYNSDDERERIKIAKLLNTDEGFSLIFKKKYIFAILLPFKKRP